MIIMFELRLRGGYFPIDKLPKEVLGVVFSGWKGLVKSKSRTEDRVGKFCWIDRATEIV